MELLGWINAGLFSLLGLIHFYWAFGGTRGLSAAVPTNGTNKTLNPGFLACAIVGIGLLGIGILFLLKIRAIPLFTTDQIISYAIWGIAAIFLIRAIGDFKYAGLFKKIKTSEFAKWDTILFSPLCLYISISSIIINLT